MASDLPESILNACKDAVGQIMPDKSVARYEQVYRKFIEWQASEKTTSFVGDVMLAYFNKLSQTLAPSTLWSFHSMLKSTINCYHNVDIGRYSRLTSFLKNKSNGYVVKKSNVFSAAEIKEFMMKAPDSEYLAMKAVTAFGMCGASRGDELTNVTVEQVKDYGTEIVVRIPQSKTKVAKAFPITGVFADVVRKYMGLRPTTIATSKFFIQIRRGKCVAQHIGKHTIAKMPRMIAEFLNLPDAEKYTGHSFRRTSTTILADAGAAIETIKRHGVWKSNSVAEGYIQESLGYKRTITSTITSAINLDPVDQVPNINDASNLDQSDQGPNISHCDANHLDQSDQGPNISDCDASNLEPIGQQGQQVKVDNSDGTGCLRTSSGNKRSALISERNSKQMKIDDESIDGSFDDFDENVAPNNETFALSQVQQNKTIEKSLFNFKGCTHITINYGKK